MADDTINIKLIHPTNNSDIDIGCPENILVVDIFMQLVEAVFLSAGQPYVGVLKPNNINEHSKPLDNNKSLKENGVKNNDTIQILVTSMAGGGDNNVSPVRTRSTTEESPAINVLGITGVPKATFSEMLKQEQSIIMALNAYQSLEEESRKTVAELNQLKQKNNDRKSAVIINTVAGIDLALGTTFITTAPIPSIVTVVGGVLMTAVGLWLTFKNPNT